jgi:prolyl-tRNA synthetase
MNFFIDSELREEKNLICGANEHEYHNIGVGMFGFKDSRYADLIKVSAGDRCSCCGSELDVTKGIEVGHIFQLGQKYAKAMEATFLDENGKAKPFYMGCYGIGISRLVAVMVEASHDEKGCIWNRQTTPFDLDIIVSNIKNSDELEFGESIYNSLKQDGYSVLLDDRKDRFGPKIKDFELIGFPYALIVGKGLKEGKVELVDRRTLEKTSLHVDEVESKIRELLC